MFHKLPRESAVKNCRTAGTFASQRFAPQQGKAAKNAAKPQKTRKFDMKIQRHPGYWFNSWFTEFPHFMA